MPAGELTVKRVTWNHFFFTGPAWPEADEVVAAAPATLLPSTHIPQGSYQHVGIVILLLPVFQLQTGAFRAFRISDKGEVPDPALKPLATTPAPEEMDSHESPQPLKPLPFPREADVGGTALRTPHFILHGNWRSTPSPSPRRSRRRLPSRALRSRDVGLNITGVCGLHGLTG